MAGAAALLDEIIARFNGLSKAEQEAIEAEANAVTANMKWIPNPGPQTDAFLCEADLLLYGGQGGGGKSDLGLGLAFTEYKRSLIMRRKYADLSALTERAIKINGTRSGFNGSAPPLLRTDDGRYIQFGANQHAGDEENWQGHAFPYKYFDEACQFLEQQIRFHLGWLRPMDGEEQVRCRAVMGSNPPINADGDWMVKMFRPWLDITYHKPAKAAELRYFITVSSGPNEVTDVEVDIGDTGLDELRRRVVERDGKKLFVTSRTFIPAELSDNPFLVKTNYQAQLDALPEPLRSAVRDGNFMAARQDADFQVIPTQWVIEAQSRWSPEGGRSTAMSAIGFDPAGGGRDSAEIALRHGPWYDNLVSAKGEETADGSRSAGTIIAHRRDGAPIVVDVGGGYGGQVTLRLKDNQIDYQPFNGATQSAGRAKDGVIGFYNLRAEAWWKFREALDPDQDGGCLIALPPDPELRADLTSPTFKMTQRGILIESKDDLRKRLGRSPGKGDAVVMAWSEGDKAIVKKLSRVDRARTGGMPKLTQGGRSRSAIFTRFGSGNRIGGSAKVSSGGEQG